jgi:demethylmenaquinone methyltransferase/2-methoxy-6-polyprenyl-1,4-benzoquinol methylase
VAAELSARKRHALALFEGLPRSYHLMGALLSFGQDPRWRARLVREVGARTGERVLDVATGTGLVADAQARRGASVVALDQSPQMLEIARMRASGVEFVLGQAEALPFEDATFDVVTFTYLLRYVDDRAAVMRELVRVAKPGGRIGMVEFGLPGRGWQRAFWWAWTRTGLPLLGRLASRDWYEAGRFLGPSIERLYRDEPDLARLWHEAGIEDVHVVAMSFGAGVVAWGRRA